MPLKRKEQKLHNAVTEKLKRQFEAEDRAKARIPYDPPIEPEYPEMDLALAIAQPGTLLEKAFAPSSYKGLIKGIGTGNLGELYSYVTPVKTHNVVGKPAKVTIKDPDKYYIVGHQTNSSHFPSIEKEGLRTDSGLEGTALFMSEKSINDLLSGRTTRHKGSDGLVLMKFPKDMFPNGVRHLDDISMRLMELGESKAFEVPSKYMTFFKFKKGGRIKRK